MIHIFRSIFFFLVTPPFCKHKNNDLFCVREKKAKRETKRTNFLIIFSISKFEQESFVLYFSFQPVYRYLRVKFYIRDC